MSKEKREELIEAGKLRPDGSRIERCPTCTQEIPDELRDLMLVGSAVGQAEVVEAGIETPAPGEED